jgi:hypothetical protein
MNRAISAAIIALLATGCSIPHLASEDVSPEVSAALCKPVTRDSFVRSTLACDLHYFVRIECGVPYSLANDAVSDKWTQTYIKGIYSQLQTRYLLSWWLHLSGSGARVQSSNRQTTLEPQGQLFRGIEIVITDDIGDSAPYFLCWRETSGQWRDALSQRLQQPYQGPTGSIGFFHFIEDIAKKATISFIFDPKVMHVDASTRVTVVNTSATIGAVLSEVLGQLGLGYELQGGVIYVVSHGKEYSPR